MPSAVGLQVVSFCADVQQFGRRGIAQERAYSIQHTAYSIQRTAYSIQHKAYSIQNMAKV